MKYKTVMFDLDGTLVHTSPEYRYKVVGQTLQNLGSSDSQHHIDKFWFETERDKLIKECFGVEPELFWKTYKQHK